MERKYKYDIGKNKALSVNLMRSHSPQMKIDKIVKEILRKISCIKITVKISNKILTCPVE